jgi:hypothetical protein
LVFIGAIPYFAEAVEEYAPFERVARLTFIQAACDAAP